MKTLTLIAFALAALVAAGAAPARVDRPASLGISVTPTQLTLLGAATQTLTVSNTGDGPAMIAVSTAGYAIANDGNFVVGGSSNDNARAWLHVEPAKLRLGPGGSGIVTVTSSPPSNATPGDHHALVLLTTSPGDGTVGIRTRVGVVTLVRIAGTIVRKLTIQSVAVKNGSLLVRIANDGNVNERLLAGQVTVDIPSVPRHLRGGARDLLPNTSGDVTVPLPRSLHGRLTAIVHVRPTPAALEGPGAVGYTTVVTRTFTIRL